MSKKRILHLHLKRKWFEAICAGTKPEEFRRTTPFWAQRIKGRTYDEIHLHWGYPPRGDTSRTLVRIWNGYTVKNIVSTEFGADLVEVFAIDVTKKKGTA